MTRPIAPVHVAFRAFIPRRRPGCKFSQLNCPPRLYPCLRFTESLAVSAQDSGPSGSLVLSRKNFAFSASCRFNPAHINRHYAHPMKEDVKKKNSSPPPSRRRGANTELREGSDTRWIRR